MRRQAIFVTVVTIAICLTIIVLGFLVQYLYHVVR
jgi:hypothetical protein